MQQMRPTKTFVVDPLNQNMLWLIKSINNPLLQYYKQNFSLSWPMNSTLSLSGEVGDWKNHFTVAENERFDKLLEKNKSSLKFVYSI